jgi:hypothetical protein
MSTKEAYRKKLEAQLKQWDEKVDVLTAKAQKASAEARIKYKNELENLKAKRATLQRTLEELGTRSEHAWEDVKNGAEETWAAMSKALERISSRFK